MHARQHFVVLGSAAVLAMAMAGPVAGVEPGPTGSVVIDLHVTGYDVGSWGGFGGLIECVGLDEPVGFEIPGSAAEASSEAIVVPADAPCWLQDLGSGDPGNYAWWGDPQVTSDQPFAASLDGTTHVDVEIVRGWTGEDPQPDMWQDFGLDVFTVDRVYLNRSGGITAEGLILCKSLASVPYVDPVFAIDWDATQYVGRKTAIHGSYRADIANFCFDPAQPTTALRWTSMHPTQQGAITAWVYGTDGRFGSGSVYVDAVVGTDGLVYAQSWDPADLGTYDPACSMTPRADGYFDQNGDGFCTYAFFVGQHARMTVRTTTVRTR